MQGKSVLPDALLWVAVDTGLSAPRESVQHQFGNCYIQLSLIGFGLLDLLSVRHRLPMSGKVYSYKANEVTGE